jgi:hypothetical protein
MPREITLSITHPDIPPGSIQGFRFFWAFYVSGYKPELHCQRCFRGSGVREFTTRTATSGSTVVFDRMDRYPYVYVCGVGAGPKRELRLKNCHFPLEYCEGAVAEATTYNGYVFVAQNAKGVPIPELPSAWNGLDDEHTRCKNFRFAVAAFGYPPRTDA